MTGSRNKLTSTCFVQESNPKQWITIQYEHASFVITKTTPTTTTSKLIHQKKRQPDKETDSIGQGNEHATDADLIRIDRNEMRKKNNITCEEL